MIKITVPSINDRAGPTAARRSVRPGRCRVQRRRSRCPVRSGQGAVAVAAISVQAMPTSRDSGRSDSPAGFWWSWASGRQAQAVSRAARVSVATVGRRLGPVGQPVLIEIAGLRHDGGPGRGEPAVQGLPVSRSAAEVRKSLGFRSVIGLPGPELRAFSAHVLLPLMCMYTYRPTPSHPLPAPLPPIVPPPPPPGLISQSRRGIGRSGRLNRRSRTVG